MNFQIPGDLQLSDDGTDLVLAQGLHAIKQRILIGITVFLGAWPYDQRKGVDYYGKILLKGAASQQIRSEITAFLQSVEGVAEVKSVDVLLDGRSAKVSYFVRCNTGDDLRGVLPFELVSL